MHTGRPASEILNWSHGDRIFYLAALEWAGNVGVMQLTANGLTKQMLDTGQLKAKK